MLSFLCLLIAALLGIFAYYREAYKYWQKRGVPCLKPSIPFGNWGKIVAKKSSIAEEILKFYKYCKSNGHKYGGIYAGTSPHFVLTDLDMIKCVMQTDFQNFMNRGLYVNEEADYLTNSLFFVKNSKWKFLRLKLSPTFTLAKMKMMFQVIADCGVTLKNKLEQYSQEKKRVDSKDLLERFTVDIIGSAVFGYECDSINQPNCEFYRYAKLISDPTFLEAYRIPLSFLLPASFMRLIGYKVFHPKLHQFFLKLVEQTVSHREENNINRDDFMKLLIQLKNHGRVEDDTTNKISPNKTGPNIYLSHKDIAAQAFAFFAAGFETTSTTITFALFEISQSAEIQDKLREEIRTVLMKYDDILTYEAVAEMKYMEKVINETLRKYPPIAVVPRKCKKDYQIPGTSVVIDQGIKIMIPIVGIHMDPELYPNPEIFDPERFNEEEKNKRHQFAFIPFGEGPRICIGQRFAIMQTKIGLACILGHFKISLNPETEIPIIYKYDKVVQATKNPIWLDVTAIM